MSTKVIRANDEWTSMHFGDLPVGEWFSFCDSQLFNQYYILSKIDESHAISFNMVQDGENPVIKIQPDESIYPEDVEIRVL